MSEKKPAYLEQQLDAVIEKEKDGYTFVFQTEKVKLDHVSEIEMIKEMDPSIKRDVTLAEDELRVHVQPPRTYLGFSSLNKKDERSKWNFSYQLVKKVKNHSLSRIHLIVCPENLLFDQSFTPYFLHYGVMESIPPYEQDSGQLFREVKACAAAAVDSKYSFEQYLKFNETLDVPPVPKEILSADTYEQLLELIEKNMKEIDRRNAALVTIPQKKWKMTRYVALGFLILLVPALAYTAYSLFSLNPKQEAFVASNEHYLGNNFSEVVSTLEGYSIDEMPLVVKYQLASSYVVNESLTEDQKEMLKNRVTLQSDPQYLEYWIHVGRGEAKEALDLARNLEERDLIIFGLIKYEEQIKADSELDSEEKQQQLEKIRAEIEQYEEEQEAQKKEEEARLEEEQQAQEQVEQQKAEEEKQAAQEAKAKEEAAKAKAPAEKPAAPAGSGSN
ncbi:type VII secretion protein EssB [Metabacillus sp. JX24]|uniref:type VII secretion protein EssB n=1 Tax=Metabacillus sp. JX24 TaxID=3240759 RepID=UPI00350FAAC9